MSHLRCVISNRFGKVYRTCNVWVFCGVKTIINVKIVKFRRDFGHAPIEFLILAMSQLWKIISKRIKKKSCAKFHRNFCEWNVVKLARLTSNWNFKVCPNLIFLIALCIVKLYKCVCLKRLLLS